MRHIQITIHELGEDGKPKRETKEMVFPILEPKELLPGQTLDQLEEETVTIGYRVLREMMTWRIEQLDAEISAERKHEAAECEVIYDGKKELKIASVVGRIQPRRQACECKTCQKDFIPLNKLLPEHHHIIITRGLEEMLCRYSLVTSYEEAHRLVMRATHDPEVLSEREVQEIILAHGQEIRRIEDEQADAVLENDEVKEGVVLVPHRPPRRGSNWSEEIAQSIEKALNAGVWEEPPEGLSQQDWERIVAQVKDHEEAEHTLKRLSRLGPELRANDLLVALDGVIVRGQDEKSRIELRVARVATIDGYRYISGVGEPFLKRLSAMIQALDGKHRFLVVLADGASWIRTFFERMLAPYTAKELVLDWYHLTKKCKTLLSMIARGRDHRRELLQQIMPLLWEGKLAEALSFLDGLHETARNPKKLAELIGYLQKHQTYIPNYRQRRIECRFNSSNAAERACNTLVARRQKNKSMHWITKGADALCALQTLWHNRAWNSYWKSAHLMPI